MNWKKLLLIGIVAAGFGLVSAPRSEAGVSIGIGLGFPGYGYGYGYPGYYGCASSAYYPYGYGSGYGYNSGYYRSGYGYGSGYGYRPYGYSTVRLVVRPHYHWRHGHRYACTERHRHWR